MLSVGQPAKTSIEGGAALDGLGKAPIVWPNAMSTPKPASYYLSEEGPLADALPQYEERSEQLEMADRVEETLHRQGVLLVEAGTGTGKTLAYLVPALLSGLRVVVSTGTRALQDQIMEHDLPLLERHLGVPVAATCMKGLSNYICRRRVSELREPTRSLAILRDWVEQSEVGDRAELGELAEDDPVWAMSVSGSDIRIGPRCRFYEDCFVTTMRQRAAAAQLVVINHHLFFADLANRDQGGPGVLPDHDAVVFDEAHRLEDIATSFLGVSVSEHQLRTLARDIARMLRGRVSDAAIEATNRRMELEAEELFAKLSAGTPTSAEGRFDLPAALGTELEACYFSLDATLEMLALALLRHAGVAESFAQLSRRARTLRDALGAALEQTGTGYTRWLERRPKTLVAGASPVDISRRFREDVVYRTKAVVLTSATLTTGQTFDFVRSRLGIDFETDELKLDSPFNFQERAALYTPALPAPTDARFLAEAANEVVRLVTLTGGGAFVLCTSRRMMHGLHRSVGPRLGVPCFVQQQAPTPVLIERFKAAGNGVLFATSGLWEGVNVPGFALRLVIIDRLPFDVPTDPLVRARCAQLEEAGRSPFMGYTVPSAALALKQGFGRLIRSAHDRGIVTILDSRIRTRSYGQIFLQSLPPAAQFQDFEAMARFWAKVSNTGTYPAS